MKGIGATKEHSPRRHTALSIRLQCIPAHSEEHEEKHKCLGLKASAFAKATADRQREVKKVSNVIYNEIEKEFMKDRGMSEIFPGDTVKVYFQIKEGDKDTFKGEKGKRQRTEFS